MMTKEALLALVGDRYDALQKLNQKQDFYSYEKEFASIWQELGRNVLEGNLGSVPANHRKKNAFPQRLEKLK
jgi:hypothetical protein